MKLSAHSARLAVEIADRVVPEYRDGKRSYSCTGTVAKRWQAAYDGACIAFVRSQRTVIAASRKR
jgi:hypothetical protein